MTVYCCYWPCSYSIVLLPRNFSWEQGLFAESSANVRDIPYLGMLKAMVQLSEAAVLFPGPAKPSSFPTSVFAKQISSICLCMQFTIWAPVWVMCTFTGDKGACITWHSLTDAWYFRIFSENCFIFFFLFSYRNASETGGRMSGRSTYCHRSRAVRKEGSGRQKKDSACWCSMSWESLWIKQSSCPTGRNGPFVRSRSSMQVGSPLCSVTLQWGAVEQLWPVFMFN